MRAARIIFYGLGGVLALLLVVVAGLAGFIWLGSAEAHRWAARQIVRAALDLDVHLDGDFDIDLGAETRIALDGLRIDNPPWAQTASLLEIERVEARILLRPLLDRGLVIPYAAVEGVAVNLETTADGRQNWNALISTPSGRQSSDSSDTFALRGWVIDIVSINDATVIYDDLQTGLRDELHIASLTNRVIDDSGTTALDAVGEINGRGFEISGTGGGLEMALSAVEPYPFELTISLPALDVHFSGTVERERVGVEERLDIQFQAQTPSLREALEAWNLPSPVDVAINADGRLVGDAMAPSLTDFTAAITSSGGDRVILSGSLANAWRGDGLDADLTGTLASTGEVAALLLKELQIAQSVTATASVTGSIFDPVFDKVSAEFVGPGGSRMTATGRLSGSIDRTVWIESFELVTDLSVPDASAIADRFGVVLPEMGAVRAKTTLSLADDVLQISDLEAEAATFGPLRVAGTGAIGELNAEGDFTLRPDLTIQADLTESSPALGQIDAAIPELGPISLAGRLTGGELGLRLDDLDLRLGVDGELAATARGRIGPMDVEDALAGELDLAVKVSWPSSKFLDPLLGVDLPEFGAAHGRFQLAGTIGDMRVTDATLETRTEAGVTGTAFGAIQHIRTSAPFALQGVAFDLEALAPSTTAVAALFDGSFPDIGPVYARAALADDAGPLALSAVRILTGPAEAPIIEVNGSIGDLIELERFEASGTLDMPANDVLALAGIEPVSDLGRLHGSASLSDSAGPISIDQFQADLRGTQLLSLRFEGKVDDLANIEFIEVQTSLAVPKLNDLADAFGIPVSLPSGLRYDGRIAGDGDRFNSDGLTVIGETEVRTALESDFAGPRPRLSGSLVSPYLRLRDVGFSPDTFEELAQPPQPGPQDALVFTDDPIDVSGLQAFDLDLEIQVDEVEGIAVAADSATGHVQIEDGSLRIDPLRLRFVGGRAEIRIGVDSNKSPVAWHVYAVTDDSNLGDFWRQINTEVPLTGELDMTVELDATGDSAREIASSLDGNMDIALQRGQVLTRLLDLTVQNPIRWVGAGAVSPGYAPLNCLVARLDVKDGVAVVENFVLDTPSAIAVGQGDIDFSKERFDLVFSPAPKRRRIAGLTTPFAVRGPLAAPAVEFSTGGAAVRMVGEVALIPVNILGSLIPFVGDRGSDEDNPCLHLDEVETIR